MREYLNIKLKSLVAEAKIIRKAEQRAIRAERGFRERNPGKEGGKKTALYYGLREHRTGIVRTEARASCLALGFLRGTPYAAMEGPTTRTTPPMKRVEELVRKYGKEPGSADERSLMQRFAEWVEGKEPATVAEAA